jgi:glycine C-acetyltransferase
MNKFATRVVVGLTRSARSGAKSRLYSGSASVQGMDKVNALFQSALDNLDAQGLSKGPERIITGVKPPEGTRGPTYVLQGSDKRYLAFNSNSYMGLSKDQRLQDASHAAAAENGVGPGAVRFINGTNVLHIELEDKIAKFMGYTHGKVLVSAYTANLTVTSVIASKDTMIISDALNHNSIIKANDFSRVQSGNKSIYSHNNTFDLKVQLQKALDSGMKRAVVITDGVFSMRGDVAPLDRIQLLVNEYDAKFPEGVIFVVDDSHGVAAFGRTGRGAIEVVNAKENKVATVKPDIVTLTFGKGFGVNGGAIVSNSAEFNRSLRELGSPYIYTNPCGPAEIAACKVAVDIIDSPEGVERLAFLQDRIKQFRAGIAKIGIPTIDPEDGMPSHPVVPLIIGDAAKTHQMVKALASEGVLTVGLTYPVVTKGEDELRMQINASHTKDDIDTLLAALAKVW